MMKPVLRIDTIFVPAPDTEAAAEWYRRIFEMVEIFRSDRHIGLRIEGASPKSTALTLIPVERIDPNAHVAFNFYTPDPEQLRERLVAAGAEVTEIHDQGAMRWFDFVDCSGNRVNVCHFPESA
jgi:catechol 2,3-dioxygenase-like lactoylglutathione lyase family enzyme